MELDNLMESEIVVAVAATAAVLSPRVRNLVRRAAIYGLAGVLMAGDALTSAGRGLARGAQEGATTAALTVQEASDRVKAAAAATADDGSAAAADAEGAPA